MLVEDIRRVSLVIASVIFAMAFLEVTALFNIVLFLRLRRSTCYARSSVFGPREIGLSRTLRRQHKCDRHVTDGSSNCFLDNWVCFFESTPHVAVSRIGSVFSNRIHASGLAAHFCR